MAKRLTDYLWSKQYGSPQEAMMAYLLTGMPLPKDEGKMGSLKLPSFTLPDITIGENTIEGPQGPEIEMPEPSIDFQPQIDLQPPQVSIQPPQIGLPLPQVGLPAGGGVQLPTPQIPQIPLPQVPQIPLPQVPQIPLPQMPSITPPQMPNIGIPGIQLPMPQLPKLAPQLGEWGEVVERVAPGIGLDKDRITFKPTPGQQVGIGKAIGDVLGRSPVEPISAIGKGIGGVLTPIGKGLEFISDVGAKIAPLKMVYDIGYGIAKAAFGWGKQEQIAAQRKMSHRKGAYGQAGSIMDRTNLVVNSYNELLKVNPAKVTAALEGAKDISGSSVAQQKWLDTYWRNFNPNNMNDVNLFMDLKDMAGWVANPANQTIGISAKYALEKTDKEYFESLNKAMQQTKADMYEKVGLGPKERPAMKGVGAAAARGIAAAKAAQAKKAAAKVATAKKVVATQPIQPTGTVAQGTQAMKEAASQNLSDYYARLYG